MNYIDNLGINYNYILNVSYGEGAAGLGYRKNEPKPKICEIQSITGANKRTLKDADKIKQFEQTLEAYNLIVGRDTIYSDVSYDEVEKAQKILAVNRFKAVAPK